MFWIFMIVLVNCKVDLNKLYRKLNKISQGLKLCAIAMYSWTIWDV